MSKATNDLFGSSAPDPWAENSSNIWLATSLKLFRNLERFKFPGRLEGAERKQVMDLVQKQLLVNDHFKAPEFRTGSEIGPLGKEFLLERFLLTEGLHQAASEEGFVVNSEGKLLISVNIGEHLQLLLMDYQEKIEDSLNKLIDLESSLNQQLGFAFSDKFGYLTANPQRCGTALLLTSYLHLPALIHTEQLAAIKERYEESGISSSNMHGGNASTLLGDVLAIKNSQSIGVNEEQIVSTMRSWATKLMVAEQGCRKNLSDTDKTHLKDLVSRAYGLLTSSYQLETFEALDALSLIKLGIDLKWVKGLTLAQCNQLFFTARRAHLTLVMGKPEDEQHDLLRGRADYVHEKLKKAKLAL